MDDLVHYDAGSECYDSSIVSKQFLDWESRCRGWNLYEYPVRLEPTFRKFSFLLPPKGPIIDDGLRPSFWTKLIGSTPTTEPSPRTAPEALMRRYSEWVAEADEPPHASLSTAGLAEFRLRLPSHFRPVRELSEQLLLSLSSCLDACAFEVIGTHNSIDVQFAASAADAAHLSQQLQAHLADSVIDERENVDTGSLFDSWSRIGEDGMIVDFGLSEFFMLPLEAIDRLQKDPLVILTGALADLSYDEVGVLQVLFHKAHGDWAGEVIDTINCFEGSGLFDYIPDIQRQLREKFGCPLFAVVIRLAVKTSDRGRSMQIARNMAGCFAMLGKPTGNQLIPLSNDGLDYERQQSAFLNRQSFRSGMLLNSREVLSLVHPPSEAVRTEKLSRLARITKAPPQIAEGKSLVIGENVHLGRSTPVTLSSEQRTKHVHVIGSSGSGKSTFLLSLIKQDLDRGEGICVIDPHGDLIEAALANVPESRVNDVILFDPSDSEYPVGFNILQAKTTLEKNVLSSDLVATFRRMSSSWGDVMDSVLANAILAFLESSRGGNLFELKRFLVENEFRNEFLKTVTDDGVVYFWEDEFPLIAGRPQASIMIRLDAFLRQALIRNIVCQKENKLDFRSMMDNRKVLLVKLSQGLIGEENAYLLGTMFVSRLYQAALSRQETQDRPYFWMYLDEFHHFITPSMERILAGTRKYNLGLILAHQEFRQMQSRSQEVASSVLSNCYTRICFRLGDADAEKFASGFSAFDAKALQNLGTGEAIARVERAEFDFNIRIGVMPRLSRAVGEQRRQAVTDNSRRSNAKPKSEVDAEIGAARALKRARVEDDARDQKTEAAGAKTALNANEIKESIKPSSPEELEHRYIQKLIKRMGEHQGFVSTIEKEVFGGAGRVDIALEKDGVRVACEIANKNTTEYEVQNIQKCLSAGFQRVVIVGTDSGHLTKIRRKAEIVLSPVHFSKAHFIELESFHLFLRSTFVVNEAGAAQSERVKGYKVNSSIKSTSTNDTNVRRGVLRDLIDRAIRRTAKNEDE